MSSQYPILDNRPIDQWKVTELKEELKRRKLATRGLKDDLIKRLNEAINVEREEAEKDEDNGLHSDPQDESDTKDAETEQVVSEAAEEVVDLSVTKDEKLDDPIVQVDIDDSAMAFSQGNVQKGESTGGIDSTGSEEMPVIRATTVETSIRITETAVSEVARSSEDFQNTESRKDNGNSKAQLENEDSKSQLESEDPKSQLESEDSKSQHESGDSKAQLENEDSKAQLDNEDSKAQLENEDSKAQLENEDSQAQLENENLKAQLANEDSKAQLANEDSKGQLENEDPKTQLDNEDSREQLEDEDSKAQLENEDLKAQLENEDPNPPHEDAMHEPSASNNQVSEVSPNLGFQVKSDSISTDSVSINEKIELKDNIIADNVKLELDVVKPEMVEPSSDEVVPVCGESHPMDVEEPHENKVSVEEKVEKGDSNVTNADLNKKNDSVDVGYSEKLNLDRSSGDDSMEEDVLETKQIDSKNNADEVGDRSEKSEMNVVEEGAVDVGRESLAADKKDVHAENKNRLVVPAEKRKLPDQEAVVSNEPLKRQRRWNSESLKVPEPQSSNITSTTTPKDTFQTTTLKRNFSRFDSTNSEDAPKERVVPPSPKPPTNSLRIDHFLRPFTLKAVQELLGKTGTVTSFWMDHIKTHCYVTYSSLEEATATRNAVYNLQWPPNGGRLLVAEFVDPREVKMQVDTSQTPTTPVARVSTSPTVPAATPKLQPQPPPSQVPRQQLLPPPSLPPPPPLSNPPITREWLQPSLPLPEKVDPPIVTLDDLFRKTKTTPRIYYLPLSEEQVAAKLAARARNTKQ